MSQPELHSLGIRVSQDIVNKRKKLEAKSAKEKAKAEADAKVIRKVAETGKGRKTARKAA